MMESHCRGEESLWEFSCAPHTNNLRWPTWGGQYADLVHAFAESGDTRAEKGAHSGTG